MDCFGGIRFQMRKVIEPVVFMSRPGFETMGNLTSSKPSLDFSRQKK